VALKTSIKRTNTACAWTYNAEPALIDPPQVRPARDEAPADRGEYRQAAGAARSGYVTLQDGTQACFVVLPTDGFDNIDNYRRHEIAHCNGWRLTTVNE